MKNPCLNLPDAQGRDDKAPPLTNLKPIRFEKPYRFQKAARYAWLLAAFCLLCFALMPQAVRGQAQLGADIDGEAADDRSGQSVSLSADGQRLAIGARYNAGNGREAGHVRVYTLRYALTARDVTFDATTGTITGYNYAGEGTPPTDIIIPSEFGGTAVTAIGIMGLRGAFQGKNLASVVIPNSVTSIGQYAFLSNNLTNVIIPNNVISIGESAFQNNDLTRVIIPNSVTTIGNSAFAFNALTSVNFVPNSRLKTIGAGAFSENTDLTSVTLPASAYVNAAQWRDGQGDTYNTGASFSEFARSYALQSSGGALRLPPPHTLRPSDVTMRGGIIIDYTNTVQKNIIIPASIGSVRVTAIGRSAFENKGLTIVSIESGVTRIIDRAFVGNRLTDVTIPNTVTHIGSGAFNDNTIARLNGRVSNGIIYARNPDGTENRATIVSYGGAADVINFIPASVTEIARGAFGINGLTNVTIPRNVTRIVDYAFYNNPLVSVTIEAPSRLNSIGANAFIHLNGNSRLASVTLPASAYVNAVRWRDSENRTYNVEASFSEFARSYTL